MTTARNVPSDPQMIAPQQAQNRRLHDLVWIVGGFLFHLVQMILAMEAGMLIYRYLVKPFLAPTAYRALTMKYPLFGYWMMVVSMVIPMIALMRYYHRHSWRHCADMTIAMAAPIAALTGLALCHLIPLQTLYGIGDPVMYGAMAVFMFFRPGAKAHAGSGQPHACPNA